MYVWLVFLGLLASVFGQKNYCCAPDQWESKNSFLQGKVDHGKVFVISGTENVSVDATKQLLNSNSTMNISTGAVLNVRVLLDYKNRTQYVIQGGTCKASPLTAMPPLCVPGTAKKLTSSYYGTPDNKLPVDIFQFQLGPNTHFVNIGQNCTPVFDSAFGSLNNVSAVSEKTFGNFTLGIKDRSVFTVPDICKHSPIRGPIPDIHRRTFF